MTLLSGSCDHHAGLMDAGRQALFCQPSSDWTRACVMGGADQDAVSGRCIEGCLPGSNVCGIGTCS